jgi:CheY-like chemotaxis protein
MATKVLLVDPDIDFAVGIKRALEQTSAYRVTTFVNGQAAVELVRAEQQDLAILDFEPGDTDISSLITALRNIQPGLFILVSPRSEAQIALVRALNVQGSITKPYLARQLIPVIREAMAARARLPKQGRATPPAVVTTTVVPEPANAAPQTPSAPVSPDFDAALAVLTSTTSEPPIQADDTFRQQIAALQGDKSATPAGLRKTLENFAVPPADDNATLGELVNVIPQPTPSVDETFESAIPPEPPAAEPSFIAALPPQPVSSASSPAPEEPLTELETPAVEPAIDESPTPILRPTVEAAQVESSEAEAPPPAPETASIDPAAEAAAKLTHTAIGSAVRATILTRSGLVVSSVGDLSAHAISGVVEVITQVWQTADEGEEPDKLVPRLRYIQVPGVGDFMLYSTRSIGELCLSMLFPAEMSLRLIRQQARKLIDSLEGDQLPEPTGEAASPSEPEAARTLTSRPTEPRPPAELRAAIEASSTTSSTALPTATYSPYTLLWLPRAEYITPDISAHLSDWIQEAAAAHAWRVQESTTSAGCVTVRIDLPTDQLPGPATDALQRATAERAEQADLWGEGYYVIASERSVTPQEIEQFVSYGHAAKAS